MPDPSPALIQHAKGVAEIARQVRRAADDVSNRASREGYRFPDSLQLVLHDLSQSLDRLFLILRLPHLEPSNQTGRESGPEAEASKGPHTDALNAAARSAYESNKASDGGLAT